MTRIEAQGKLNKKTMTVTWTDGALLFNGASDPILEADLRRIAADDPAIGGTYYPRTEALRMLAALDGYFFDRAPESILVEGDIGEEIPGEPDVIY